MVCHFYWASTLLTRYYCISGNLARGSHVPWRALSRDIVQLHGMQHTDTLTHRGPLEKGSAATQSSGGKCIHTHAPQIFPD